MLLYIYAIAILQVVVLTINLTFDVTATVLIKSSKRYA